ncbi:caspase family protein [Streptomyces sp. NPDC006415]|uniref:caspase family protein n=1 Tax=Streptomyces sp. NPDC006415 TaxID=3155351 RepID=UPI0033BF916A
MNGSTDGSGQGTRQSRRYLIATAVAHYPKCAAWDRPSLVEAREQIIALFTQELGYHHHTTLGLDPTRTQLTDRLRAFCRSDDRREDDLVVIYLSGHGEVVEDGHQHVLLMADTDPDDVSYTSLPTAELVRALRGTKVRRLLLILDTCYSGQGGNELAASALERLGAQWAPSSTSPGLVVVSSAQPNQQAKAGLFPQLLSEAVGSRATAGHAPTHLSVSAVVEQMNKHPDRPGYQHINLSLLGLTGEPPDFFTNPRHNVRLTDVDLALQDAAEFDAYALQRETEFSSRFLVRAMGYSGNAGQGWWFCGRRRVLAELAAWLNQTTASAPDGLVEADIPAGEGVRVVTAGPGSGKTAVLGLVGALTMPDRRRTVPLDSLGLDPDLIPAEGGIDVVMYAQNLTDSQVLAGLAAAAGFRCTTVGQFLEAVDERYRGRRRPFTVLIDALDEAATPATLCSQIVRPLIEHARGRIRLLLGTRPYLLDCLGLSNRPTHRNGPVIDLDSPRYTDRKALLAYTIRNLVQSHATSPYRRPPFSDRPERLRPIARAVADAAGDSFLVARFAAYTLASADTAVPDPQDARWRASLPRHAGQAMRDDLTQRLGPDAQRATDLLRPLAYAEGQGLPWEDIWAPLATAISGRPYNDDDLLWLRRNAGSYVVEATENGRSAYRLYHQALTEHIRESTDEAAVHSAFVDTLTDQVPYRGDATRDWSRAHPYTLNYLAIHAATARRLDGLLNDTEYLVHAVPRRLTPHLHHAQTEHGRLTAAFYRSSLSLHATATAPLRRRVLALDAARVGATAQHHQLTSHIPQGDWAPQWATGSDFSPALRNTLVGHTSAVRAVACSIVDGVPVAVTGDDDGTVRMWDLASGTPMGNTLVGHTGAVRAVACSIVDGVPVAVTGDGVGTVRVWDLASGTPIGQPFTGHTRAVRAVACSIVDGVPVAVTGDGDGAVRVWDLASGTPIGEPLTGHKYSVFDVACSTLNGVSVAVTGGWDCTVRMWDLASGTLIGEPLTGSTGSVMAVACSTLNGVPVAVAGDGFGTVWVWDLASGTPIGEPLTGQGGEVFAVACSTVNGVPVAVTGSIDGTVRVRDLASGALIGEPFTGHTRAVEAVACSILNGVPVAVTGDGDGTVRVWDLASNTPIGQRLTGHNGTVPAVRITQEKEATSPSLTEIATIAPRPTNSVFAAAYSTVNGVPVAVTGGRDGTVRTWDLASGTPLGQPLNCYYDALLALACTTVNRIPVAVTGHGDCTVRMWDLASGTPLGQPFTGHRGSVFAVACTTFGGAPVAVTGDGVGTVRVWDLASGTPLGQPFTGHTRAVEAVACSVVDGVPVGVTGDGDGAVRVWDLASGTPMGNTLVGHTSAVRAVACSIVDGVPVAVTGDDDGTVRVWDLASGTPVGQPLTSHTSRVFAVACRTLGGALVAVTGSDDDTVRVWDLPTGESSVLLAAAGSGAVALTSEGDLVLGVGCDVAVVSRRSLRRPN